MAEVDPSDLTRWSLHCFSPTARSTPHSVVGLDNNGVVLAAARRPVRRGDLAASGITVTDSQIRLLCEYRLLEANNDVLQTTIPILGSTVTGPMRERLGEAARSMIEGLAEPVGAVRDALAASGHRNSTYALVFGHALDGVLWTELAARGELPPIELDLEHPYWRGLFWASFPKRPLSAGTNFRRVGASTLVLLWTDDIIDQALALEHEPGLDEFVAVATADGSCPTSTAFTRPDRQLVDQTGRALVPAVDPDGAVHRNCEAIARLVTTALNEDGLKALVEEVVPGADRTAGVVVVTHELIWTVTDQLVAQGIVEVPPLLSTGEGPIRDLLYLYRSPLQRG